MGFVLMMMLALLWGFTAGAVIENTWVSFLVSGVGGYFIAIAFQHFGLLGV